MRGIAQRGLIEPTTSRLFAYLLTRHDDSMSHDRTLRHPPVHRTTGKGQPPRTVGQRAKPVEARRQMRDHEVVESCGMFMMMLRNLAERDDAARDEGERTCYHIATSIDHLVISSANP